MNPPEAMPPDAFHDLADSDTTESVQRDFVRPDDLTGLLRGYRSGAQLASLIRLTGGSKKGVYRLVLADESSVLLYVWREAENYWPAGPQTAGDPFTDASGAREFQACHAALAAAGVRIPALYALDFSQQHYPADIALVEDIRGGSLEDLLARDPVAAARPMALLGAAVRVLHEQRSERFGKVADLAAVSSPPAGAPPAPRTDEPAEDVILSPQLAAAEPALASLVRASHAAVAPRRQYGLVHGELGPGHVLLDDTGAPVLIDIEGVTWFDVEWEHAFLRLTFGQADYVRLGLLPVDEARVAFYDLAQRISLVEGPLRIATTDYPERDWMLELAQFHTDSLLAEVQRAPRARRTLA
jgi:hypothetical protein